MNKTIIWALFDDAQQCYKNAIKHHFDNEYLEVHSIGINDIICDEDKYFYHKIDLSITNPNLIKQLSKLPHPDIILASPPCESWSGADCGGCMVQGFDSNDNWKINNYRYYDNYNKVAKPNKKRDFYQKEANRIIGESTISATIKIIRYFHPKLYVIENPATSRIWEFIDKHHNFGDITNKTYYSSYDSSFSTKPTIFRSNFNLHLICKKYPGNKNHMNSSYAKRSSIPFPLIRHIVFFGLHKLKHEHTDHPY